MKCHVCGFSIPEGKKFCPGCGRVLTAAELQKANAEKSIPEATEATIIYRPASTGKLQDSEKTTNIPDIFSTDPNAPEYTDPHTYDKATADILEYDKQFVSRKNDHEDSFDKTFTYRPARKKYEETDVTIYEDEYEEPDYDIEPEDDDKDDVYIKKAAKPHINIKILIVCIAVIAGMVIIITGTYKIGQQFGFWGEPETSANVSGEEDKTLGEKAPVVKEPESTSSSAVSDYKIGTYTVSSDQSTVFMYKSETDARIIATIPNLEVIKITEISGEMGKTTYGSFTGWVYLEDLEYAPDKKLPDETTTAAETTTALSENNNDNSDDDNNTGETTTKQESEPATGTYTVDLHGDGTYLNVRDTSSTDGTAISRIDDGAQVTVDKIENGWGHITTADGIEGWVYMIYLK